jgi:hypothetical protein
MPTLKKTMHERFARLVAQGMGQTAAYAQVNPTAKYPDRHAVNLMKMFDVQGRIAEIREIVDSQYAMLIGEKRDVLRRMALGEVPTKVIKKANGQIEAVFDRLGAIITDAKLAGEFAAEKVTMEIGPTLKLDFKPAARNTAMTPALEAEILAIEGAGDEPEPVVVQDAPVNLKSLEDYTNVEIDEKQDIQLADIAKNNIFVDPSEERALKLRELRE